MHDLGAERRGTLLFASLRPVAHHIRKVVDAAKDFPRLRNHLNELGVEYLAQALGIRRVQNLDVAPQHPLIR